MAVASEVISLNEINYKSKIRSFFLLLLGLSLFILAFVNSYPVGEKIKLQIKSHLAGSACNPDIGQIRFEWLLPKIIVSDLTVPASCFNRQGDAVKLTHVTLNYHLVNFSPLGLPFRLDTELGGQPISLYYVLGIGKQMIRLKDQPLVLSQLEQFIGNEFKLAGTLTVDLNLSMEQNLVRALELRAASKTLQVPSQSLQGFTLPNLRMNEFFLEATSDNYPRIKITKLILGDTESPIRANFKGKLEVAQPAQRTALDLSGELAFSQELKQSLPLIDMMFQSFTQTDGFYQIRLGGTLDNIQRSSP